MCSGFLYLKGHFEKSNCFHLNYGSLTYIWMFCSLFENGVQYSDSRRTL